MNQALKIIPLSQQSHPLLADYFSLTDLKLRTTLEVEGGLFIAESYNVIQRAIAAGAEPRSFLTSSKWLEKFQPLFAQAPNTPIFVASEAKLQELTGFHVHRGALASMKRPKQIDFADLIAKAKTLAVFENIVDHTNLGAMFRSAAALGVDGVVVSKSSADPLYRRAIRVSMGTVFQVPWCRAVNWPDELEIIKTQGFEILALALTPQAVALNKVDLGGAKVALLFGSEGYGLSNLALAKADQSVVIPMSHGVDSLNVAAASAVVFWHRQISLGLSQPPSRN